MDRVQTFLPYPELARSAAVLDPARLGKQRVETLQVLRALELPEYGWRHHPVVRMWRGHTPALVAYGLACVEVWTAQGRADTTAGQILEFAPEVAELDQADLAAAGRLPSWLGDEAVHRSHRSALVRKDPAFYRPLFGDVPDDLPYVWPDPAPPAEAVAPGEVGTPCWVVRCAPGRTVEVAVEPPGGRSSAKWRRQVQAFRQEMAVGDVVAVPLDGGGTLRLGTITGTARDHHGILRRTVRWSGELPRAGVLRPATLQDPRSVFRVALAPC
jgi:hypothetical protein